MFQKVHKLRHLKSNNNRIELFNLSAIARFSRESREGQKTENSDNAHHRDKAHHGDNAHHGEKDYSKMRQVLINQTHKWRTSSQVIAKERS